MERQFVIVGDRVQKLGKSIYRYDNWPDGKWLKAGVCGTVIEYHKESPAVTIAGELFESLPPYAVVKWDLGDKAITAIDKDDENETWKRLAEPMFRQG